jgi:selenocysteine lyase/cysteine desulfurase
MAIAALGQISEWEVPRIAAALADRTSEIARRAAGLGLDPVPDDQRGPHLLGVRLPEGAGEGAVSALAELNCFVALRASSLRISPHLHANDDDVERLFEGLARVLGRSAE